MEMHGLHELEMCLIFHVHVMAQECNIFFLLIGL